MEKYLNLLAELPLLENIDTGEMFTESISCADVPALPFSIQAVTDCEISRLQKQGVLQTKRSWFWLV